MSAGTVSGRLRHVARLELRTVASASRLADAICVVGWRRAWRGAAWGALTQASSGQVSQAPARDLARIVFRYAPPQPFTSSNGKVRGIKRAIRQNSRKGAEAV